ncbi:hypothetical protein M9Y10_020905 [Tritrichomonas musculus]|uniref:Autotransporter domain-containing protein n=1 Tax=Tritrichomonas musculus TaxID=1915356 RepID=A0ABR2HGW8_9EUKA
MIEVAQSKEMQELATDLDSQAIWQMIKKLITTHHLKLLQNIEIDLDLNVYDDEASFAASAVYAKPIGLQTNAKFTFDDDYKTSFSGTIGGGKRTGVSTGIECNQKIEDETYFRGFAGYDKSNGANASFLYEHRF